jgi:lantibiotic modifying enzyme
MPENPSRRDAIRVGVGAAMLAALPAPVRHLERGAAAVEPDGRYLDAALGAARWLRATAVASAPGTTWPTVPPDATPRLDLYSGSPGVVLFLVELHRATGDRAWLDLATAGADHLAASLPDAAAGDGAAGLYTGLAGLAFTLETVARASGNARHRAAARKALGTLVGGARDAGAGAEWSDTTDIISGSAGVGLYLLRASATLGDASARPLAERVGRRLLEREHRTGDASLWMMAPSFPRNMPNFSHGTAGVAYFLAALGAATREPAFVNGAVRGARYLQEIATPTAGGGRRIFHNDPDGRELFYLSWCHGPAGTARLFHQLGVMTGERGWSAYVAELARGIVDSRVPERSPGFWNNVSQCCGNCGVSDFFVDLYGVTRDPAHLAFARRCADDTLLRATADGDGLKWVQAENRVSPNVVLAQTGLMQGAAGVGLSMLRLDGALRGRKPAVVLPDSPFA